MHVHGKDLEDLAESSGAFGFVEINDTALYTGDFVRLIVIVDSVFTTLTGNSDFTLPLSVKAGEDIGGKYTDIQLSSGNIKAYKGGE